MSDNSHNNGLSNSASHNQQFSAINGPDKILPSPSVERKEFDFSKVNGKFSEIYYLLQTNTTLNSNKNPFNLILKMTIKKEERNYDYLFYPKIIYFKIHIRKRNNNNYTGRVKIAEIPAEQKQI